ncbi:hypothetical protein BD414DRAFT_106277 [Trametes punicea]|nr:hypothetical protein BD414DRAFT_106277 [Trametes punicea]
MMDGLVSTMPSAARYLLELEHDNFLLGRGLDLPHYHLQVTRGSLCPSKTTTLHARCSNQHKPAVGMRER